jgi:MerR family transcriptional regulator, copper efflux regulator
MADPIRLPLALPEKEAEALLQVGDLARESGKTVRAIHLYEELGLLKPLGRSKGGYRLYAASAPLRIRWIQRLQDMGFSLTDIRTIVHDWEQSGSAPRAMTKMRSVYDKKLEETRMQLIKLEQLKHELEKSLEYLDTCDVCEPDRLLSTCNACNHHDCQPSDVPELVAGFHQQRA